MADGSPAWYKAEVLIKYAPTASEVIIATTHENDDPWALNPGQIRAALTAVPERPALRIETIDNVEPLDTQIGAFPKKTVQIRYTIPCSDSQHQQRPRSHWSAAISHPFHKCTHMPSWTP